MSKLEELIQKLCPDGVQYRYLWELTIWDKKFNAVDRAKQPKVINYHYLLAADLFALEQETGDVFLLSTGEQTGWTTEEMAGENLHEGEVVTIPWGKSRAVTDCIKYYKGKFVTADNRIMTSSDTSVLLNKYLYYWIMSMGKVIDTFYRGSGIKHPDMAKVLDMKIPAPPLPVQREIVRILDNFTEITTEITTELTARKKQYEYYRDILMDFEDEIPKIKLKDLFDTKNGYTPSKSNNDYWNSDDLPWFRMEDIRENGRILNDAMQKVSFKAAKGKPFPKNSIIISTSATIGEHALLTCESLANQRFTYLVLKDEYKKSFDIMFLYYYCFKLGEYCRNILNQGNFASVDMSKFAIFQFPIISIKEQQRIVDILNRFDTLCNDITSGLPAEIEARQKQYEYYRDKLLTFKPLT